MPPISTAPNRRLGAHVRAGCRGSYEVEAFTTPRNAREVLIAARARPLPAAASQKSSWAFLERQADRSKSSASLRFQAVGALAGSEPLINQDRHAVAAGHDLVVVTGRFADHVGDGDAVLVRHEQAANTLAVSEPHATLQAQAGRDVDRNGIRAGPAALLDSGEPRPAGARQKRLWPRPLPQRTI
jgi:hypothetical protein